MKIVDIAVTDLKQYRANPRNNEDAVKYVKNSIKEFGFKVPIVVDKDNVIVAGHTRYLASLELGLKKVPCIVADDLSEDQIKAFRIADNKVSEASTWDDNLLNLELSELADVNFDMSGFGFEELFDEIKDETVKEKSKVSYESMELKAFEHYDYVVFVFDNQMDWLNIVNQFDIKNVNCGYGETKKIGVGRVINGKKLLEKLGNKDSDNQQIEIREREDS